MATMITKKDARRVFRTKKHEATLNAAERWATIMRYPRELTDDAARGAALAYARSAGLVARDRQKAIDIFTRAARVQAEAFNTGRTVFA